MNVYTCLMSKRFSLAEARARLPALLDEVEAGAEVEITRRGKAVAVVLSRTAYERLRSERPSFAEAYARYAGRFSPEDVALEPAFVASLRETDRGRKVRL